jgi:hypothetical protein
VELTGIKSLYGEMKQAEETRQQFRFAYNEKEARVLFLIDTSPFLLCFCAIGAPQYFQVEVQPGFIINTFLNPDALEQLRDMFGIGRIKKGEFSTADFFSYFNDRIPQHLTGTDCVRPQDMPPHVRRDVEEADRIYFWRFRINGDNAHVSESNLQKTRSLLGEDAYEMCKKNNISTQWTDILQDDNSNQWKQMLKQSVNEA